MLKHSLTWKITARRALSSSTSLSHFPSLRCESATRAARPRRDTPAPSSKRSTGAHSPSRRSRLRVTREPASPIRSSTPFSRRRTSARAGSVPSPSGAGPPPAPGAVVMRPTVPCPVRQLLRSRVGRARVRFRASDSRFELEVPQPVAVASCQLRREGRGDERDRPRGSSDGCRDSDAEERPFPAPPSPSPSRPPPPSATRPGSRIRGRRCVRVVVACRSGGCRRRSRSHRRRRRRRRSRFCYRRPLEIGWRSTREGGLRPGPQEGHEIEQVNQRPQPALGPYSPFGDGDEGALSS